MKRWLLAASVVVFAGVSGPCAPPPEPTLLVTSLTAQPRVVRVGQATLVTVQAVIPDFPGLIPPSVNLVDVTGFKPVVVKRMDASGQIYSASFEVDPEETGRRRYQVTAAFAQEVERKKSRILEIPVFEPASSLEPMEESLVEGDAGDVFPVDQLVVNFVPGANRFRVEMLAGFVAEEVSDLLLTPVVLEIVGFFPKTNGYQFELRCEGDTLPLSVCASGQDVEDLLVALEAARQAFEASPIVQGANRNVFVFPEADFDSLTSTQQSGFNRAGIPGGWQAIADAVAAGDIPAEVLSKTVELGVLDVGIDVEHPDLDGVSYRSPRTGESPQAPPNCLVSYPDNTSQGCNDQPLWCVSAPICSASIRARNVQGVDNQLFTRHGSFVTGLLAGDDGDRASGGEMNGVATGAPVGPLEFRIELGRSAAELHASLDRVTDTANVVNLSIGWHSDGSCDSTSMDDFATIKGHFEEFISHEDNQDVLFVASAGNCDVDLNPAGSPAHVPGGLAFPNLLTVGASYDDGGTETKAAFSNDMASPPADFHMLWAPGVGLYGPRGGAGCGILPIAAQPDVRTQRRGGGRGLHGRLHRHGQPDGPRPRDRDRYFRCGGAGERRGRADVRRRLRPLHDAGRRDRLPRVQRRFPGA